MNILTFSDDKRMAQPVVELYTSGLSKSDVEETLDELERLL